jgi:hypothetical protein
MQAMGIYELAAIRKLNGEVVVDQVDYPIRRFIKLTKPFKFEEVFQNRIMKETRQMAAAVSRNNFSSMILEKFDFVSANKQTRSYFQEFL